MGVDGRLQPCQQPGALSRRDKNESPEIRPTPGQVHDIRLTPCNTLARVMLKRSPQHGLPWVEGLTIGIVEKTIAGIVYLQFKVTP